MFNVIIVIYNSFLQDSPVYRACLNSTYISNKDIHVVDNSIIDEVIIKNKQLCSQCKFNYYGYNENLGLSKAYNIGIEEIIKSQKNEWIIIFDQDTEIGEKYFETVYQSILENSTALIHMPIVSSLKGIISPVILRKNGIKKVKDKTKINDNSNEIGGINSGLIVHKNVYEIVGLYDEELFLDMVDFNFFRKFYETFNEKNKIKIIDYEIIQEFSGDKCNNFESDYTRFLIFLKDYNLYCDKNNISLFERKKILLKRAIRLTCAHKKMDFLCVIKNKGRKDV